MLCRVGRTIKTNTRVVEVVGLLLNAHPPTATDFFGECLFARRLYRPNYYVRFRLAKF